MCVFHCRPCLSQVSQDPTYLHTAIIKCHCQCLLWDSRPSIPPFPKGERLEAEREDKKRKNILYSTSSTNTIPFFLLVTLQHLERSKHRWHAHREGWQIRRRVGLNILFFFNLAKTFTCKQSTEEKDGFLMELNKHKLLASPVILIKTDSLVIPVREWMW